MIDPEGCSYEFDRTVTLQSADKEEKTSVNQAAVPSTPDPSPSTQIDDSNEELGSSSIIPQSWWNFDSSIECLLGSYMGGPGSDNSPQGLSRVDSSDPTLRIIAEEARKLEEEIDEKGSDSDSLSQLQLYDDQNQKLSRPPLERRPSGTATTTRMNSTASTDSSSFSDNQSNNGDHCKGNQRDWKRVWTKTVQRIGSWVVIVLRTIAKCAARNPYLCIISAMLFSIAVLAAGWSTNFKLVLENQDLWPPHESFSLEQANWLYEETEFNYEYRYVDMIIHAGGSNVLSQEGVSRVFEALDTIRSMPDYQEGCSWAELVGNSYRVGECKIHSVADFWNESQAIFESEITSNDEAVSAMGTSTYPSGQRVDLNRVIGNPSFGENGRLITAQSFLIEFDLPWSYETEDFELEALDKIFHLQQQWESEVNNPFRIEVNAYRSYEDEFFRSIIMDLPLLPGVFAVMCLFCCLVFWRRHKIDSQMLLGMGAVVCIVLSIMASFGLLFLLGVPFTTSTTMLPFLMFGIGLDDAFIIFGSYKRTHGEDTVKRIETTIDDIGLSIFITTATSALAFGLGCFSNIPAVSWLCMYAILAIIVDFLYQITFFVALIVLDERRIEAGKLDCLVCVPAKQDDINGENHNDDKYATDNESLEKAGGKEVTLSSARIPPQLQWPDRFMRWYADKLLRPTTQKCILAVFIALLSGSMYSASQLRQYFDLNDLVPHDSYLTSYFESLKSYGTTRTGLPSFAYFRRLDQSNSDIQQEMVNYLDDLFRSDAIASPPTDFWVKDFKVFSNQTELQTLSFTDQLEAFLSDPVYHSLYYDHIVRDTATGELIESRCEIYIDINLSDSRGGIEALDKLRSVTRSQPVNRDLSGEEWKMFTYQDQYHLWEFYSAVISELTFTAIMGVAAVSIIAVLLIPHWTAVFFITSLIICLYVDMLGYINYANVHVNAISYVQLVMSIGLMVDFIMHVLMRYYECSGTRRERVKETLETMGASILVGGLSSFLGVSLLAFSTSQILNSVFVSVMGLVVLGILHGLVFLPVLLSVIGPE